MSFCTTLSRPDAVYQNSGETEEKYRLDSKDEVLTLIDAVAADAREDYDFIETLESSSELCLL
ncbi:hypothetical protein C8J36_101112 [Rhizobium sp. PP-F2F-G48]|nr:hypothetical protein C8J36_101112 [Rhizobium sp. PP-F2F-G48]